MKIKGLNDYDIVNYKKPSLFIAFPNCSFKCGDACQNKELAHARTYDIPVSDIVQMYVNNPLAHSLVCGGLEPFDSFEDLLEILQAFRAASKDDIIIYTGYNSYEIVDKIKQLCEFDNIIIKFGRYIKGRPEHYDKTLGVTLVSDNQFAVRLNNKPKILDLIKEKGGYCPCSLIQNESTLCCCDQFKYGDEQTCHCGLYNKD